MVLTEINKLTYVVVVLLLPLFIQAQLNEFVFSVPNTNNTYVNVTNTQEIKLTCNTSTPEPSFAKIDKSTNRLVFIAYMLTLQDGFSDRYNYTNSNGTEHVLTIKYANMHEVERYYCFTNEGMFALNLKVFYPPNKPTCTALQSTTTILVCKSELGKPAIDMTISGPNKVYTPTEVMANDTHIVQSVALMEYKEDIKCTTTYSFIQNDMEYSTEYSCMFDDILGPSMDKPTVDPSMDKPTVDPSMDKPTVNPPMDKTTADPPRDSAYGTSSTITKYSVLTLAMVILSRTI